MNKTYDLNFSIIVVTYNGKSYVDKCLASIFDSTINGYEIIVVDNGSTDGTLSFLKKKYAAKLKTKVLKLVSLKENFGPAYARNKGVARSKSKYIGFLDNDTVVDKNWAQTAYAAFENDLTLGCIQCKLLLASAPNSIDYVGEYLGQNGFLVQRAVGGSKDDGSFDEKVNILAAKSAGMFIRRAAFEEAGRFDPDYFIYVEETDLGWRVLLQGYHNMFLPDSIVFHEFGTSSIILSKSQNSYNAKFHGSKNYILTHLKNLEFFSLCKILPLHILLWIGLAWFSLLRRDVKSFIWIHKGVFWNVVNLPRTIKKRNTIQNKRLVTDKELFANIMVKMNFKYFLNKATVHHKVGNAEGFIKSK